MSQDPPVSIRLDKPDLDEYRAISKRTDIAVATLLRWACVNYLRDIRAGHVVLMPFADRSHVEAADDPLAKAKESAVADAPQKSTRRLASPNRKRGAA